MSLLLPCMAPCHGAHHGHGLSIFLLPSIATWGHGLLLYGEPTSLCLQVWLRHWAQTHLSPALPAVKSSLWKWERRRLSHRHSASPSECESSKLAALQCRQIPVALFPTQNFSCVADNDLRIRFATVCHCTVLGVCFLLSFNCYLLVFVYIS